MKIAQLVIQDHSDCLTVPQGSDEEFYAYRCIDHNLFYKVSKQDVQAKKSKAVEVLDMIIADCDQDVKDYEHAPFTGKTVGELHGILQAKIQALAKILKEHLEEYHKHD